MSFGLFFTSFMLSRYYCNIFRLFKTLLFLSYSYQTASATQIAFEKYILRDIFFVLKSVLPERKKTLIPWNYLNNVSGDFPLLYLFRSFRYNPIFIWNHSHPSETVSGMCITGGSFRMFMKVLRNKVNGKILKKNQLNTI